ncbi:hypothetical protein LCGC14_3110320 [marine sediment metagenome]|uniref:Uncharacterized protein n=1 Tax=marine sediment metagenome TaxID=412755 RepID=A0A0F8W5E6_9ZZZZ
MYGVYTIKRRIDRNYGARRVKVRVELNIITVIEITHLDNYSELDYVKRVMETGL